jgi:proteasome activator subunit 4
MEEDDNLSVFEDVGTDASDFEKQKAILQAYIDSVPYKCESLEEMNAKLEVIVGKIAISARAKNWLVLATWDGLLQCWLLMRYPMIKTTRAKLVRLYYELCLLPGIEPRVIRSWADMLSRLLPTKSLLARKLDAKDLQLPWKPLWQAVQKELWPKRRIQSASRNVVNLLLYVAELCKRYFPASDIPDMLQTFLPVLTQDTFLSMIPIIVSFLPPTHTHLYLPTLYKLGEALNSSAVDDRLLDLAGELSEEHVAGTSGDAGEEGGAEWKDIGIWNQEQWTLLMGKVISSLSLYSCSF